MKEAEHKREAASDFLTSLIQQDVEEGLYNRTINTRFPPEPNGYLHIGSAYAIHVNSSIAKHFDGVFNLRFDDTNPLKEDLKYVQAIEEDLRWLGLTPKVYFGSDYSDCIYEAAVTLIRRGKAYVCDLSPEQLTEYRGTLREPGKNSPYRERSVEENIYLFEQMRKGEFESGAKVLRAKIEMSSPNITLRDPVLYRIIHAPHYRTGTQWCIYPTYDFAHPIQDAIEGITHSLCSAEFKEHRPLYEWVLQELEIPEPPKQREFGRLNLTGQVTSKRYLRELVEGGFVDGWDDPRLPTLMAYRRRGVSPESIFQFMTEVGMLRQNSTVDSAMLDHFIRQDLKGKAINVMAVLDPLKVVITNYPEGEVEMLPIKNNETNEHFGVREVPFSRELYIEREDFMQHPAKGYFRLSPGQEVRLKGAYYIRCESVIMDPVTGEIVELHCTYDPETKSGTGYNERKVKSTIHWVSATHAEKAEVRLYDHLLKEDAVIAESDNHWAELVNPHSMTVMNAWIEPMITSALQDATYQFIRHGYFSADPKSPESAGLVFNRTVSLKDGWKKHHD
ncbi:glutamine--tRNA ligase/YqeY domain fusion protein [Paenibacillus shunpengii]|uniref:Glutamine--tRNA ligase n=1 Tax=Paenibacillus shunpengii TaxID=2054424 RepID=A0ABW5SKS7_9BACL